MKKKPTRHDRKATESCLVLPNDPLSIYQKQGNLHQFLERLEYYADALGPVYVLNVDREAVAWSGKVRILNVRAFGFKPLDLLYQFGLCLYWNLRLQPSFNRSFESCTFLKSGLMGLACILLRKPFVVSIHGTYRGAASIMGYTAMHQALFRPFEWLTQVAANASLVIDAMYVDELRWKNMHVVPNFVDTDLFKPSKARKKWDAVFVGSLTPRKGIDDLVAAFQTARKTIKNLRLAVAGHGPLETNVKGVPGVTYLGAVPHEKLPQVYNQARCFVTATLHEGFAIPIAEAQACGLPIVATDLPPFHHNTQPGKTSYLSPVQNPEAMAKNLVRMLHDETRRKKMGKKARQFVAARFSKTILLQRETSIIRHVLEKK